LASSFCDVNSVISSVYNLARPYFAAWFKNAAFWVTTTYASLLACWRVSVLQPACGMLLVSAEARIAEHFQPVRVRLAGQQFAGAFAGSLGMLTAQEAAMIEEELQ